MQDSKLSPEVQNFVDTINQNQAIASIVKIVEQRLQEQLESHLLQFQQTVAQGNAAAIDLMQQELQRVKEESTTVQGAISRLSTAIAPDIPINAEVVTFRQAIQNLETCGSILPSDAEIASAQLKLRQDHAWSLFRQSIAKIIIKKLERIFCKPPTSTEPTGTMKDS